MIWPFRRKGKKKKPKPHRMPHDTLVPPEGVPLHFDVAGVGARIGAQMVDILITVLFAVAVVIVMSELNLARGQTLTAIFMMLFFLGRIPYYVITELLWNGQTLGKRMLKLKVVSADGRSLTAQSLVVRNLMKEAEVFLPGTLIFTLDAEDLVASLIAFVWIIATLAVPLLNKRRQRLGDMAAGTYVIHLPEPILLPDLAQAPMPAAQLGKKADEFTFLPHQLDHYGAYELQTLEDLLRTRPQEKSAAVEGRRKQTLAAVIEQIRKKIDYAEKIPEDANERFLRAFYNAQRAHLEQRQLFGDKRADKHHGREEDDEETGTKSQ